MTTLTIEIDKDNDLSALKEFIDQLGLKYEVAENNVLLYTDEMKNMLDKRYADYKEGITEMVSKDESRERVQALLATKSK